jgi:hypothetical protein
VNFPIMRLTPRLWLILLIAGVALGSCQAPQSSAQCCRLGYGLLQPNDLDGKWELVEAPLQIIQPTASRYEEFPSSEEARQYLSGNSDERNEVGVIVHDVRRYPDLAQDLGKLDFKIDAEEIGTPSPAPDLPRVGEDRQTQCLASKSAESGDALIVCIIEVRYLHALSTMYFYFDGATSSEVRETLINQAVVKTDERMQEIDRKLGESDS